ncbi:ankyrin [Tothia fuscella]|uniref:Ankyrin n=1 Tax=Tothia fuscella TaxID=1048955 RepID=A0A9P4NI30_9PEZI|nr:ankyrin [Tothia fuscella]
MHTTNAVSQGLHDSTESQPKYEAACISGDIIAVQAVLELNPPTFSDIEDIIAIAARYHHLTLFRFLLQHPATTSLGFTPVLPICRTDSEEFILALNKKFPDILQRNYFVGTPLQSAIGAGCSPAFLEFLIDLKADSHGTCRNNESVLRLTTSRTPKDGQPSTIDILTLLLKKGANLKYSGVLCGAIRNSMARFEIDKSLLEQGAHPNTDILLPYSWTSYPLHLAVRLGDLELINLLLENEADLCLKSRHDRTALDINDSLARLDIKNLLSTFVATTATNSKD